LTIDCKFFGASARICYCRKSKRSIVLNLGELKKRVQEHFRTGLVTLVGSGLSAASGLPTMTKLEKHLREKMPARISSAEVDEWERILAVLETGQGLEVALHAVLTSENVGNAIVELTAALIEEEEARVIRSALAKQVVLPFSHLLPHITPSTAGEVHVITSNYDRLLEVSAETIGWGVDTMFVGQYFAALDEKTSRDSFLSEIRPHRTSYRKIYRKRVRLFKPHGSLDWYELDGEPIRSPIPLDCRRLMITPGAQKYKRGYESIFERHRAAANGIMEEAERFLIVGYGFNDEHLEKTLRRELHRGKPCLLMTLFLSPSARAVIAANPSVFALVKGHDSQGNEGTEYVSNTGSIFFPGLSIWSVDSLVQEVF
jgi:SIR2-like domain